MYSCSMKGCPNTSYNSHEDFYTFPKNFNICMLWVQNCGRDELFQEFIYGGAEPFLNKWICSGHFRESDFVNNNKQLGLKPKVLPIKNCQPITSVVIKQELLELPNGMCNPWKNPNSGEQIGGLQKNVDVPVAPELHALTPQNFLRPHQIYYAEDNTRYAQPVPMNDPHIKEIGESQDTTLLLNSRLPDDKLSIKRKEIALRKACKRLNESDDQRRRSTDEVLGVEYIERLDANARRTAFRRANENSDQRKERLRKNAERARIRRSQEMFSETLERRMKNAMRAAERRRNETPDQRLARRLKDKMRARRWRAAETEEQLRERRYKNALSAAMRRNKETEEQALHRKQMNAQRIAQKRANSKATSSTGGASTSSVGDGSANSNNQNCGTAAGTSSSSTIILEQPSVVNNGTVGGAPSEMPLLSATGGGTTTINVGNGASITIPMGSITIPGLGVTIPAAAVNMLPPHHQHHQPHQTHMQHPHQGGQGGQPMGLVGGGGGNMLTNGAISLAGLTYPTNKHGHLIGPPSAPPPGGPSGAGPANDCRNSMYGEDLSSRLLGPSQLPFG